MKEKVKEFWDNHKKEILISTGLTIAGGVLVLITKSPNKIKSFDLSSICDTINSNRAMELAKIEALDCNVGSVTDLWNEGGITNLIVNDVKVSELGKLGKELLKLENVTDDSETSLVIGILKN